LSQAGLVDFETAFPSVPTQFDADVGSAIPIAHILDILGTNGITTSGAGKTITVTGVDATTLLTGVSRLATDAESIAGALATIVITPSSLKAKLGTQTLNGLPYGLGAAAAIGWTAALTNGQILIGSTGAAPVAANLLSAGGSVTITNSAGGINLEAGASVPTQFDANVGSALPALNILDVVGTATNGINTTGAASTLTIGMSSPYADGNFVFQNNAAATTRYVKIQNTDGDGGSSAALNIEAQATGGDSFVLWSLSGATRYFAMGIDNSDNNYFKFTHQVDPSSGNDIFMVNPAASTFTHYYANILQTQNLLAGGVNTIIQNTNNTNIASDAFTRLDVGGASAGDPFVNFLVTGAGTYSMGIDNTVAGDPFKITDGASPSNGNIIININPATANSIKFNNAYEWPTADGTTNYVLKTDGAGNIDFAEVGTLLTDIANTYYVGKHGNDANDGKTASNAKLTIQAAVTAAAAGDTILVFPGTYTETITHAANNVSIISQGVPLNVILQQADANVVNVGAFTNIAYTGLTIQCTAATTAINTIQASTGSIYFRNCILRMTSATDIVAAAQPAIGSITGAGIMTARWCQVNYAHTGNCGAGALKAAFLVNTGGDLRLWQCRDITIANSGTALASTTIYDQASTGIFSIKNSVIDIADPDASIVVGMADVAGTGATDEFYRNTIHVTVGAANAGYGLFIAAAASIVRSIYNHIHVTDAGGASYSFATGATSTLVSQFDDIIAVDGKVIAGTFTECSSESDGNLSVTGLTDHSIVLGSGSAALTPLGPLTDGQLAIGSTGNAPTAAMLTAGTGISITPGAGSITIASATGGMSYEEITDAAKTIVNNYEYGCNRGGGVAFTLPAASPVGSQFKITGITGLWNIVQGAFQYVCIGSVTSTVGAGGSISATNLGDCITCTCIVENVGFRVTAMMGNITVV
jgi:hypothetical protein